MFGYIVCNKPEMKFREFDVYRSYYCGLCAALKERYGLTGQVTLSYDLTFLILLLTGLYEPGEQKGLTRCAPHPLDRHPVRRNIYTDYAADMNLLLAYHKALDDWEDERRVSRLLFSRTLSDKCARVTAAYPDKAECMLSRLSEIHALERKNCTDVDRIAGAFGEIMATLFLYRSDEWADLLHCLGFFLGKYVYLLDAYDDIEKDLQKGAYNPFRAVWEKDRAHFDEYCGNILTMMMAECSRAFEALPILTHADILRNILYGGVWTRFEDTRKRRLQRREKRAARAHKER